MKDPSLRHNRQRPSSAVAGLDPVGADPLPMACFPLLEELELATPDRGRSPDTSGIWTPAVRVTSQLPRCQLAVVEGR